MVGPFMYWLGYTYWLMTGWAWPEYGEPTVDEEALGTDGAEAVECSDGAASACVCCMLCDMDLSISYLKSCCCPSGNISYGGYESIMLDR